MAASYVHGASDVALLGETIGTCLDRISAAHGDCDALVSCYQRVRYTYRELHAEVERYARGLLALGVERGDRVGIWGPNSAEWLVTQYATAKIGAILVNINPAYRLRELDYALNQSGVATLVMSPRFRATDYVAMLSELAPELAARRRELASARLPDPFYHCFGCVLGNLAALTHASAIVLPAESFEAESCLEAVQDERCTSLYGVPTMFIAELEHPAFSRYELSSLRTGIMAGAPCPVEIMRQVIDRMHMPEVTICYGMTETSPVSFQTASDDRLEHRVSTVGRIHPHVECKIVDHETGVVVPRGHPGELCTRGYSVMLGYWGDPDATAEAIDPARWMHTGDLAVMRDDGYVNIVGRLKDMIIRGGENVYPRAIEEVLQTHPTVSDVQD